MAQEFTKEQQAVIAAVGRKVSKLHTCKRVLTILSDGLKKHNLLKAKYAIRNLLALDAKADVPVIAKKDVGNEKAEAKWTAGLEVAKAMRKALGDDVTAFCAAMREALAVGYTPVLKSIGYEAPKYEKIAEETGVGDKGKGKDKGKKAPTTKAPVKAPVKAPTKAPVKKAPPVKAPTTKQGAKKVTKKGK